MKKLLFLLCVVVLCLSGKSLATESERFNPPVIPEYLMPDETLRGVKSVEVLIEYLSQDAKDAGLRREQLQTDVELKLRTAGIRVYDEDSIPDADNLEESLKWSQEYCPSVTLYLNINSIKQSEVPIFAFSVCLEIQETVTIARNSIDYKTMATTWKTGSVSIVGSDNFKSGVRELVGDHVNKFINDYLKMNPKE